MSLPFDLTPGVTAALALALIGAAFVRGYSGFGFSAIVITFAAIFTNPLPLIPVVFACEMLMTIFQARGIRPDIDWRRVGAMLAGAAIVLPLSVGIILSVGEDMVRLIVSTLVLIMSLVLLSGWTLQRAIHAPGHLGVGIISGVCNGAGVGGAPVAVFMAAQPMPPAVFRATMIAFLTGLDLITLPLLWVGGLVTWETAIGAALAFPLLGLGVWLGGRQFLSTPPAAFRRFAVFLLLILSGAGLIRAAFA
ncbi:sulfite exporter TauE/SafE family protein [Yoonia sp. BS5-3]|uniref:Probable membrane transporter protein n=1 Tax=Yoonia phaeophyticola TaxID=3137369 RepID=A0ABZ2V8S9_9RHOB